MRKMLNIILILVLSFYISACTDKDNITPSPGAIQILSLQENLTILENEANSWKSDAYLISIVDHLSKITGKKVSLTSVHIPLSRLEKSELIISNYGEATAVRGGRRKKVYRITNLGMEALEDHKRVSDLLWKNYPDYLSPKE